MLTLKNKKLDRKFYPKVGSCDQTHTSLCYCLFLFIMTNFLPCLHKAHILISSEILYFELRLSWNESSSRWVTVLTLLFYFLFSADLQESCREIWLKQCQALGPCLYQSLLMLFHQYCNSRALLTLRVIYVFLLLLCFTSFTCVMKFYFSV